VITAELWGGGVRGFAWRRADRAAVTCSRMLCLRSRQVVGDHAGVRGGEHEVFLDGQQQLPPGAAARFCRDLERADTQGGPAAGVLGEFLLSGGQALPDKAAALQADVDEFSELTTLRLAGRIG